MRVGFRDLGVSDEEFREHGTHNRNHVPCKSNDPRSKTLIKHPQKRYP